MKNMCQLHLITLVYLLQKNIERIEELKKNLERSENLLKDRLDKNKILEESIDSSTEELNILKVDIKWWKMRVRDLKEKKIGIEKENKELKESIEKLDKPLDEKYKLEYKEFKNTPFFEKFGTLIDDVENNSYSIKREYSWKDLKYLKIKWIIEETEDSNHISIKLTSKWDKFAEFFLDEYTWESEIEEDINPEDVPF